MKFKIIEKLGGYEAVVQALGGTKYNIASSQTIRMWESRRQIPPAAELALLRIAEERKIRTVRGDFQYAAAE